MGKRIDLAGMRFGKLTVVERAENILVGKQSKTAWWCKCDCGNETVVITQYLKKGDTKSCGCIQREATPNKRHGFSKTRLYGIWSGIIGRCCNSKNHAYHNYGGRGIRICEEWRNDFLAFYKWAYANGYREGLTIERKDVNGNYEPSNCIWATMQEQANNTRCNKILTLNGESHTVAEWGRITNLGVQVIRNRLRDGFTVEETLTLPKMMGSRSRKNIKA